jgi:replicative DNA helicase
MLIAQTQLEKPLPHYLDAERSILATIMMDNPSIMRVIEKGLDSKDFFLPQHRQLFELLLSLNERSVPFDLVTVSDELNRLGKTEEVGGTPYLAQLLDGMWRVSNLEYYVQIVREKALLRNLIYAAERVSLEAMGQSDSVDDILDRAESTIFALAEARVKSGLIPISNIVRDNFERLEKIFKEGKSVTGLPTGYTSLDRLTSGLQASELIILAARPSQGKTALALNLAENIGVRAGLPIAIFSLEMSKESLLQRMVASLAQIDSHKFRTGKLGQSDWQELTQALGTLGGSPIWIDDSAAIGVLEIGAKARRMKREKGLSLVIVDYLQLITARGRFGNRQEEVASISRALKGLAKELQVPVLVLSQLTRAPERDERGPQLSDLRESGAIEQDADVVMFIYRPHFFKHDAEQEERDQSEIIIAKQRNGPTDKVKFIFRSKFTRFEEAAPDAFSQFSPGDM